MFDLSGIPPEALVAKSRKFSETNSTEVLHAWLEKLDLLAVFLGGKPFPCELHIPRSLFNSLG